jgi:hypothetical protein
MAGGLTVSYDDTGYPAIYTRLVSGTGRGSIVAIQDTVSDELELSVWQLSAVSCDEEVGGAASEDNDAAEPTLRSPRSRRVLVHSVYLAHHTKRCEIPGPWVLKGVGRREGRAVLCTSARVQHSRAHTRTHAHARGTKYAHTGAKAYTYHAHARTTQRDSP